MDTIRYKIPGFILNFNIHVFMFIFLLGFSLSLKAVPISYGALLYDQETLNINDWCNTGVTKTNNPGKWSPNINTYNNGVSPPAFKITRLYPWSGELVLNCDNAGTPCVYSGADQNVFYGYSITDAGPSSVSRYYADVPGSTILAIIDSQDQTIQTTLSDPTVAKNVAAGLAEQICADDKVDGVFFDLEPDSKSMMSNLNLFYLNVEKLFTTGPNCVNSSHPQGRLFGIFMNPNNVVAANQWTQIAAMLGPYSGFLVVGGYGISNDSTQTPLQKFINSLTGKIQTFDPISTNQGIRYTVAIPAAATPSEYQAGVPYPIPNTPNLPSTDTKVTQLNYVTDVVSILQSNANSSHYLGMDFWSWTQYNADCDNDTGYYYYCPTFPQKDVLCYFQQQPLSSCTVEITQSTSWCPPT